jgi:methylmalonyl-CoA/ethylmalonyl-CoA epimerase
VADVGAFLEGARADGVPTLDPSPRRGVHGSRIGFLDPEAVGGTLLEFVEPAVG